MEFVNKEMFESKCGVYKITNKINGAFYYGKAKWFKDRYESHLYSLTSSNPRYGNERMKEAVRIDGIGCLDLLW